MAFTGVLFTSRAVARRGSECTSFESFHYPSAHSLTHLMNIPKLAAYYFPNYHIDSMNERVMGDGWTEWELVKSAKPRFEGHRQPTLPTWGYFDESLQCQMQRQVDAAVNAGIQAFLFDWYWFEDRPFLNRPLDDAFIKNRAGCGMEFALMWANHDWQNIFPAPKAPLDKQPILFPNPPASQIWENMTDYITTTYLSQENYLRIDGCPFFFFFNLQAFIEGFENLDEAAKALRVFDRKAQSVGAPRMHYSFRASEKIALASEWTLSISPQEVASRLGMGSIGDYGWEFENPMASPPFPKYPYNNWSEHNISSWSTKLAMGLPYSPCVQVGWDSTARCTDLETLEPIGYPWWPVAEPFEVQTFKNNLLQAKEFAIAHGSPLVTINAWNEWTEGSYLLPCESYGDSRLKAVKEVFLPA